MATLFFSLASFYNRNSMLHHHLHRHQQPQLLFVSHLKYPTKKNDFVCFACSTKQARVRKRVKSNEELRSEIMNFVASAGLPQGHVPSMKELCAHERVDLANIVRRRGYKFIRELLANSDMEHCSQDSSPEADECASVSKDDSSLAQVSSMELSDRADIESSSSAASMSENHSLVLDDTSSFSERESENVSVTKDKDANDVDQDSSLTYDHYTSQDLNLTKHVDIATESLSGSASENTMGNAEDFQNQLIDDTAEIRCGSADDSIAESDDKDRMLGLASSMSSIEEKTTRFIQNGYLDTVDDYINDTPDESCPEETKESVETTKGGGYSHGVQRTVSTAPNGSAVAFEEATQVGSSNRNSNQMDGNAEMDKDSHDETMKRENQVEITRLRFMLRQKELELSRLKEQIEKEKLSLSVLQRKAETEIQKAQMLVSEKDVELQEAEESLSGLQEVEIEYCGDGNVVEVTGSFNGWEHRVGLELDASKLTGKQKCWSTLLWLYPGTYEIKFIVDDQWITDPQRDSVTRGHITNNILKVDKR
ncbi:unnamed protein product [Microthlaspi erraticum]|uniref:AMP-activated protein kinase glycogen-binding domain-containing protein n=1 Tax=Microthlaspi erraticum TaxID=1685480 RepID=A0A6D2J4K1_9BRAS|nr:unnamed protein product [Microthlaspi erraticum]